MDIVFMSVCLFVFLSTDLQSGQWNREVAFLAFTHIFSICSLYFDFRQKRLKVNK